MFDGKLSAGAVRYKIDLIGQGTKSTIHRKMRARGCLRFMLARNMRLFVEGLAAKAVSTRLKHDRQDNDVAPKSLGLPHVPLLDPSSRVRSGRIAW